MDFPCIAFEHMYLRLQVIAMVATLLTRRLGTTSVVVNLILCLNGTLFCTMTLLSHVIHMNLPFLLKVPEHITQMAVQQ